MNLKLFNNNYYLKGKNDRNFTFILYSKFNGVQENETRIKKIEEKK
jgi:hypothetical protein